jgi:hypothetical protein
MKKILIAAVLCCSMLSPSFALAASSADPKVKLLKDSLKKDSITLNTAYLNGQYTNKQLANFNIELLNVTDRIFQNVKSVENAKATLVSYITYLFLMRCNRRASTALHEVGHGLRCKSYGIDYAFGEGDSNKNPDFQKNENFFQYFIESFLEPDGLTRFNPKQVNKLKETLDNNYSFCNAMIICDAGGMNNQMQLAEKISDNIYSKKKMPDFLSYMVYLKNMVNPGIYDIIAEKKMSNDPFSIIHWFGKKGENNFKKGTIAKAGLASLLLSATTYSVFTDKPLEFHGFRLPDVFPYITTKGMSYKVVSGYEIDDDLNLIFGFETTLKNPVTECSLGINHLTAISDSLPISYRGIVTFGQGLDFEASCSVALSKNFSAGLGCEIYSVKSLQGQRNATANMKKDNGFSKNFFAFVSYRY